MPLMPSMASMASATSAMPSLPGPASPTPAWRRGLQLPWRRDANRHRCTVEVALRARLRSTHNTHTVATAADGVGRGLHSSTSQLNLSRFLTQNTPSTPPNTPSHPSDTS
jgi:hypothetical protein